MQKPIAMKANLFLFIAAIASPMLMAGNPEIRQPQRVTCLLQDAKMEQKLVEANRRVTLERKVILTGLHIPQLSIVEETVVLQGGGVELGGMSFYEIEHRGLVFIVYPTDEALNGPVTLKRIRILRKAEIQTSAQPYECEVYNLQ